MHISAAFLIALLSTTSLATARYGPLQHRSPPPTHINARAPHPEDLHARAPYDTRLHARSPSPQALHARSRLSRRDELSLATADVLANFKAVMANPDDASITKFNANAEKQVALAKTYQAEALKAGTSPQRKKMLLEAVKVLESDDPPPGITMAQLKAAGFEPTTVKPGAR
ncbi:hypothetical protein MMC15_008378 [Xylographa vitiligo]|nr:hypothetical protein [Xylographa vitiligo]